MDAAGLAALVAPSWFQSVSNFTGPAHAGAAAWTTEGVVQPALQGDASQTNHSNYYD